MTLDSRLDLSYVELIGRYSVPGRDPGNTGDLVDGDTRATVPIQSLARLDVYGALESSPRGLTSQEALARLERVGPNDLPRAHRRPVVFKFFAQFTDLFAVVLLVASAITFLAYVIQVPHDVGNLQLAIAILGVVLLNAVIGFFQEYSAERTAEALQAMVPRTCRVIRGGDRVEVSAREGAGRSRRPRGW